MWLNLTHRSGVFSIEFPAQFALIQQLKKEAGIKFSINESNYDLLSQTAGKHGYGVNVTYL